MAASENHEVAAATVEVDVWVWDHDRRRIVWANERALRFWGERTILDLIDRDFPPNDPATIQFARLLRAASTAGDGLVRARLTLTPAGRPRRVDVTATRFALSDGRAGLRIGAVPLPVGIESEPERMREIFATAPQAMSLFAGDGSLLIQNDAAELTFGSGRLSGLAARYAERGAAGEALRGLLVNGAYSRTTTFQTRAGPRRHRLTMRRILDPVTGDFAALASFDDAVERGDLRNSTILAAGRQDDVLLDAIDAGVAVYDDALKPLHMSDRARSLLDIPTGEEAPSLVRIFPRDRRRIADALLRIRDGFAETATVEIAVPGSPDTARWIRLGMRRGRWQGASAWIATIIDVTDTQRFPDATRQAEGQRDVALDAIGIGTVQLDTEGSVLEMNATAACLLGREPGDRRPLAASFDARSAAVFDGVFAEEARNDAFDVDLKDGGARLSVGVVPKDRFNRDRRTVVLRTAARSGTDGPGIFERKEAVARASHELRTPLNAILGFTQLMLDDPSPIRSEAYVEYLRDINTSGAYMLRLLQDLLDMRRIEADALRLDSAPIDLGNLLRVVAREVEFAARKRDVEIILSVEPDLPPVLADTHTMRQAITNLVGNAVKFTAPSGWVRISAMRRASGAVEVEVIDNGEGMTDEELETALRPFGQMPGNREGFGGAGMGVPLAKGFVEANRGRFELSSEKGLGTMARIVFPPDRVTT